MVEHRQWEQAWSEAYGVRRPVEAKGVSSRGGWLAARRSRRPWLLHAGLAALMIGTLVSPFAVAATGDTLREGVRNGTSTRETEIIGRFNASTGAKGGYVTRQSNTQTGARAGGGAIYGCRGAAGGTAAGSAPCLRATNLANGYAFELSTGGGVVGLLTAGNPAVANPNAKPFVTNATGVATGLNADEVDGQSGPFLSANGAAVNTANIADNAVTTGKIADGQVRGPDLGGIVPRTNSEVLPTGTGAVVIANCLAGETRLSGGGFFTGANLPNRTLGGSFAVGNAGWAVGGHNASGANQTLTAQVLCLQG